MPRILRNKPGQRVDADAFYIAARRLFLLHDHVQRKTEIKVGLDREKERGREIMYPASHNTREKRRDSVRDPDARGQASRCWCASVDQAFCLCISSGYTHTFVHQCVRLRVLVCSEIGTLLPLHPACVYGFLGRVKSKRGERTVGVLAPGDRGAESLAGYTRLTSSAGPRRIYTKRCTSPTYLTIPSSVYCTLILIRSAFILGDPGNCANSKLLRSLRRNSSSVDLSSASRSFAIMMLMSYFRFVIFLLEIEPWHWRMEIFLMANRSPGFIFSALRLRWPRFPKEWWSITFFLLCWKNFHSVVKLLMTSEKLLLVVLSKNWPSDTVWLRKAVEWLSNSCVPQHRKRIGRCTTVSRRIPFRRPLVAIVVETHAPVNPGQVVTWRRYTISYFFAGEPLSVRYINVPFSLSLSLSRTSPLFLILPFGFEARVPIFAPEWANGSIETRSLGTGGRVPSRSWNPPVAGQARKDG